MDLDFSDNYIVNNKFSISDADTEYKGNLSKDDGKKILEDEKVKLRELQDYETAPAIKEIIARTLFRDPFFFEEYEEAW